MFHLNEFSGTQHNSQMNTCWEFRCYHLTQDILDLYQNDLPRAESDFQHISDAKIFPPQEFVL